MIIAHVTATMTTKVTCGRSLIGSLETDSRELICRVNLSLKVEFT